MKTSERGFERASDHRVMGGQSPALREEERPGFSLSDFVNTDAVSGVDPDRSRIRKAPDDEQRRLIPIAKGGGNGVARLLDSAGFLALPHDEAMQTQFSTVNNLYTLTDITETRTLDGGGSSLSETRNFLGTLILDLQEIFGE